MQINVRVTPNAKVPAVIKVDELNYRVKVNAQAIEGKANERLVEILAEHFKVKKSCVRIIKGQNGRNKIIEVL